MHRPTDLSKEALDLGQLGPVLVRGGLVLGILGVVSAVLFSIFVKNDGFERFAFSYLLNVTWVLSIALGAFFWLLVQHITRAAWSVVLRRVLEGIAGTLPVLVLLLIPIALFVPQLYYWADPEIAATDPLVKHKVASLNQPFFIARPALYALFWAVASRWLFRSSVGQDGDGDPQRTLRMERASTWMMFLFALTATFAAFDLLMSLDAHWFSTIFGVYFFSGCALASMSLLAIVLWYLQARGRIAHAVTREHYHDVGKLMFAFVVFWAYIAFSQYMLIWYAHIPEETGWFLRRQQEPWLWFSIALIFGHFFLPFLALISRVPKRRKGVLALAGAYLLAIHWVDLYWLIMPEYGAHAHKGTELGHHGPWFSVMDLLLLIGMVGFLVAAIAWRLRGCALLPVRDPRLAESLTFENA